MNAKVAKPAGNAPSISGADIAKDIAAALLLAAGLAGYWLLPWAAPLRGLVVFAGLVLAVLVFSLTAAGRQGREFIGEARFELRKVVWPTREQSIRTTGVIIVVIIVMSILLFMVDSFLGWTIGKLL